MTDDLIRREDAIEAVAKYISMDYPTEEMAIESATLLIDTIPTAKPKQIPVANVHIDTEELIERIKEEYELEPKRGEWIWVDDLDGGHWHCSACKTPTEALAAFKIYPFCPFCGAIMNSSEKPNNCGRSE